LQKKHRRARSSIGVNRKASASREKINSKNRGAQLSQTREKNSNSAMAQLHQESNG